jgi:hypothetical protein
MKEQQALYGGRFECLGSPVQTDESRSAAVCKVASGQERVVIAARGYVLIIDPLTGICKQVAFPEGHVDYPFASFSGKSGMFYTGAGSMLMVLDPFAASFVAWYRPAPEEEIIGMAFAEDVDGNIYTTTYPSSKLVKLESNTGECKIVTQMDPEQKYAMSLALDDAGWVYAGVGTTAAGFAAYQIAEGTSVALLGEEPTVIGNGQVYKAENGEVYGTLPTADSINGDPSIVAPKQRWFRLCGGEAFPVSQESVPPSLYRGIGYNKLHRDLSDGRKIAGYQLSEGELVLEEMGGSHTVIPLSFLGNGTDLSPMAAGPDGKLYGTSNHPLHLYRYDPIANKLENLGGKIVELGGGGNICAFAAQGPYLLGAAYTGGRLHKLDTREALSSEPGFGRNPRLLFADDRIHRPRIALAHSDDEHVLYGGFPGYGSVGGALGIIHVPSETVSIYEHDKIVPFQSTLGLALLSNGDVIGSTSIVTPGGAEPLEAEAVLYRFDWKNREVSERHVPIPNVKEISLLVADRQDYLYALTSDSLYFVFDPMSGDVIYREDLSKWGSVVRQGLLYVNHSGKMIILGLLNEALFSVGTDTFKPKLLAALPKKATCGMALLQGNVYYGCGSELWRYNWEKVDEA